MYNSNLYPYPCHYQSNQTFTFERVRSGDVVNLVSGFTDIPDTFRNALQNILTIDNVEYLGLQAGEVVKVSGTVNLNALNGTSTYGKYFAAVLNTAQSLGMNNPVPVTVTLSKNNHNGDIDLGIDFEVINTFREITFNSAFDVRYKFKTLNIAVHATLSQGQDVGMSVEAYGLGFAKLSSLDPWLEVTPKMTLSAADDGFDRTFGGKVHGKCHSEPTASTAAGSCTGDWSILQNGSVIAQSQLQTDGSWLIGELNIGFNTANVVESVEVDMNKMTINGMNLSGGGYVNTDLGDPSNWHMAMSVTYLGKTFVVQGDFRPGHQVSFTSNRVGFNATPFNGALYLNLDPNAPSIVMKAEGRMCVTYWWDPITGSHEACTPSVTTDVGSDGSFCLDVPVVGQRCVSVL